MEIQMDYATFRTRAADVNAAMAALGAAVDGSGLEKELTELVKIRASQLNGCGFCHRLHRGVAAGLGLAADKLDGIAAWRSSGLFSDRERAAFEWTEFLTARPDEGAAAGYQAALLAQFTEDEAIYLTVTVGTINQWNRMAIGLGFTDSAGTGT